MPTPAAPADFVSPPVPPALSAGWLQGTRGRRTLVLVWFSLFYVLLQLGSLTRRSATFDEPLHLAAGYAAIARQDYRYDMTHPPLARMWAALPLLGMEGINFDPRQIDRLSAPAWNDRMYEDAFHLLFRSPDPDATLARARFMNVLLGLVLGFLLFFWADAWLGFAPAVLVLICQLLSPNLGAHATLVTTDLAVTLLFTGTIHFLWRLCRRFSAGSVAGLALCFGAALASKFSSVLLVPVGAVLLGFAVWRAETMTWRRAAMLVLVLAVTGWAVIWATYGFRHAPSDTPGWLLQVQDLPMVRERLPVLAPLLSWLEAHHLLPNAYAQGFLLSYATSEIQPAYLAGEVGIGGWWYYFPVAFLIKTPSALIVLSAIGLVLLLARARQLGPGNVVFLLVPPALFLAAAMSTDINIGLRHILPVYPFVLLVAVGGARQILAAGWRGRTKWLVLGALGARWAFSFAVIYPHTLTFFNLFVGGPSQGYRYLVDSNLDWGQHLKLLKEWMADNKVEHINLAYFGMGSTKHLGINCTFLPGVRDFLQPRIAKPVLPGYVAISATVRSGAYLPREWRLFYEGFEDETPVAVLGNSISVYWVDEWPETDRRLSDDEVTDHARLGDRLQRLGWPEHALWHYDRLLARRPDESQVHARKALALFAAGRNPEAVASFHQAIRLAPDNADYRGLYASALIQHQQFHEAVAPAQALVRMRGNDARAHFVLGVALAGSGRFKEAVAELQRALALEPGNATFREYLDRARRQLEARGR